ncbi:anti-sigma-factor antagonist [Xylanimonas cellulosilytica DSM 15894]|uniref:Anti-sigma factor antagonist n=1 Tax=Xylanimonas cellulosilytica (strain DSM 15894 / JCM 12276 / CECT 5975 / KCTC 9989 / LMG 20990 / NBRC 107835 / XIL07) TaxID=446471 RepID=D1BYK1_XYLCX|nr:STAS domain-containing protein [Xylanimonas cellulosilytica]ACZ31873.1 anti-sigma-factor antagonist [Xylanimonas cellulosilytica DSM 15894]
MDTSTTTVDGVVVVTLTGKLDNTGSQTAQAALVPAIVPGGALVIDMTACDYVASSGLRVLLIAAKQAAMAGCRAVLCGVRPAVWDVIVMTGFEDVLAAYPTQADALSALAVAA